MKKQVLALLLVLLLLPLPALGWEIEYDYQNNYMNFPELDGMKTYFRHVEEWTLVTGEDYTQHMDRLLARGDTEEAIHARFGEDTLLWEAYWDELPQDTCMRMECFEDEYTREVWNLYTLSTKERSRLVETVGDGLLLEKYHTYSCSEIRGNGKARYVDCNFTTWPPERHESGAMRIWFINGKAYVLTYNVLDRLAGRKNLRSGKDSGIMEKYSPLRATSTFKPKKFLPELTAFALNEPLPTQADVGNCKVSGTVQKGGSLTVTLDGEKIPCKVSAKGTFTVTLPLETAGDHEVVFTASHKKYTQRTEAYTVNVSARRTPLTLTETPEMLALAGKQTIAGKSDPGAFITLRLDEGEILSLTADEKGAFKHTFEVMDDQSHEVIVTVRGEDKDLSVESVWFVTEYATVREGTKAFQKDLTEYTIGEMAKDPDAYKGERVKISVKVQELCFEPDAFVVKCTYNPPKGTKQAKTPLTLTLYNYAEDQLYTGMTTTVYGTVLGGRELEGETYLDILLEYGTYLVSR